MAPTTYLRLSHRKVSLGGSHSFDRPSNRTNAVANCADKNFSITYIKVAVGSGKEGILEPVLTKSFSAERANLVAPGLSSSSTPTSAT
jgi:hypothetical protein